MATRLHNIGWGLDASQIETSLKEAIENFQIPLSKDLTKRDYITFENVTFRRDPRGASSAAIKEAVVYERSILTKIKADVVQYTGARKKVLARGLQVGQTPQFLDDRKSFITGGSEYNLINQPRRKSSAYVFSGGGTAVADFNLAKGRNFSIKIDSNTGFATIIIGGTNVPLRPLLESVGINRNDLVQATDFEFARDHWDRMDNVQALLNGYRKLYGKLFEYRKQEVRNLDLDTMKEECTEYFKQTSVDRDTTKYLFHDNFERVDRRFVLKVLEKFHKVNKGEEDGIDPDDLYYQRLYPPNMLFKDRIEKIGPEVANSVRHKMRIGHSIEKIFTNIFSKYLISMVNSSDLSRLDPQYNPIGIYGASTRMSPIGMGGIQDIQAVTRAKRGVHSSYIGVVDPTASAQGQNVGVQLSLTDDVKIDEEGEIYLPVKDKSGKIKDMRLADTYDKRILLPGQQKQKDKYALHRGKIVPVRGRSYDLELPRDTSSLFNTVNQLVPFPQGVQGNRSFMTSRQITQAVPLLYGETPYVEPVNEKGVSTYRQLRKNLESLLPMESSYEGEVTAVKHGEIHIKDTKGDKQIFQYHEHLPFATNTGVHQKPLVKKGDKVKKGQMLVKDAYTTDDGKLALGKNLKFGFMPYYGDNTEDGVVISEAAAEKLTSVHYYTYNTQINDTFILNKSKFQKQFGAKYEGLLDFNKYDENGILKKGETVNSGEPVFLVIERRTPDDKLKQIGRISKNIILDLVDGSQIYNGEVPGEVVDVAKTSKFASVTVSANEPAKVGDKLTGLYGNKGTISTVLANDRMIQDESGEPLDLLYSSTTVVSRINPPQVVENALGKIVKKTGRAPYQIPLGINPGDGDLVSFAEKELKKHGVKDKEKLFNPVTGKHIERPIAVGEMYMLKLLKGDKDITARGVGPSYSSAGIPAKGGKEGAKAIGTAEFQALVAHNARSFLTDAGNIKGQKNEEYYKMLEMGLSAPVKTQSEAWEKAKSLLTAAGGYVEQDNSMVRIMPLTDRITDRLAQHRTIRTPALLNSKNLEPMKRGLFDPAVTGGPTGKNWSKINLEDGLVSPLVVDYVRLVLGKTAEEMRKWQVETKGSDMKKQLNAIDIDKKLRELKKKSEEKNLSNSEIKQLRFLHNLKKQDAKLGDLVINKLPVPPPIHRPITQMDSGSVQISDINLYYKDVMLANEAVKETKGTMFEKEAKATLLDNVHALAGTAETKNIQLKKKGTRGIMSYMGGVGSPKNGYIHSNLMKKNQDLSGRARIIANPRMSMDEIGIPEKMAWELFEPHMMRKMKGMGIPPLEAGKLIKEHHPQARKVLDGVMENTNVFYNRAPTLHRFSFLAAKPKAVPGTSIHLNLAATKPLNADFDGDAIQIHVPTNEKVSKSLEQYKLSNMPFSDEAPGALVLGFTTEAVLGLYQMSKEHPAQFKKDMVEIVGKNYKIPVPMPKKAAHKLLSDIAGKEPEIYAEVYDKLLAKGSAYATDIGSTVGLEDIRPMTKERDTLVKRFKRQLDSVGTDKKKKAKLLQDMQAEARKTSLKHKGDLKLLVESGAKGSDMQLSSILVSPVLSYDPDNPLETVELTPSSYAEGLSTKDFWMQNMKVRKDAVGTALNVAVPGSLGKLMTYNTLHEVITTEDCGTTAGINVHWNSKDVIGRYLQETIPGMKRNTAITPENVKNLPKRQVLVRSPQKCAALEGVCQKCYGTDSYWKPYPIGTHVGIRAATSVIEPLAQKALDSKHGGRDITRDIGKGGISDLTNLFSSDPSKSDVATLAVKDDTVESVEIRRGATHLIKMVSGEEYKVHPESEIIVKAGDRVKKADPLTKGVIPYTEVTKLKGVNAGRTSLVQSFRDILGEGSNVHNRLSETIAKGAINYLEVLSSFGGFIPGDNIPYNKFLKLCEEKGISVPVQDLKPGMNLAEEFLDFSAGHPLTQSDIENYILKSDKKKLKVLPEKVRVRPAVKSFYTSGMLSDDWLENLSQKYIKKTITTAAAESKEAPVSGISPVKPWLMGRPIKETGPTY